MKTITITIVCPDDCTVEVKGRAEQINRELDRKFKKATDGMERETSSGDGIDPVTFKLRPCEKCGAKFDTGRSAGQHRRWCKGPAAAEEKQTRKWARALVGPPPSQADATMGIHEGTERAHGAIITGKPMVKPGERMSDCCLAAVTSGEEARHERTGIPGKTYCAVCKERCLWKNYNPTPKKRGRPAKVKAAPAEFSLDDE